MNIWRRYHASQSDERARTMSIAVAIALIALGEPAARAWTFCEKETEDFGAMTIEELLNVRLSLSRTDERVSRSASAAHIITGDDIRRSGATSIPEALRGTPGLEVARVDAHTWAITSRGFNDTFANKLLVMIDGRTVYTPLFSGTFWDVQDTLLEDVEHIEIIRGPGSTLWGANAVNGVINIVTKQASQTQGGLITGGGGIGERAFGAIRYGGKITEEAHYRAYVKYFDRDDTVLRSGHHAGQWDMLRGGFRADWTPGTGPQDSFARNTFTIQGDAYSGAVDQTFTTAIMTPTPRSRDVHDVQRMNGGNILGRWSHQFSEEHTLQFQTYYDRTYRKVVIFQEDRDTFDVDFQHRFKLGERNSIIWGAGYRVTSDDTRPTSTVELVPDSRTVHLFSTFVQDEITVIEDRLRLTLGSKLEHNDFTGWEVQPGARLLWTISTNQNAWASATRAVRTPSRAEDDIRVNAVVAPGVAAQIRGDERIDSENVMAYEIGYRIQPITRVSFDVAAFYNDYENLHTLENTAPVPPFFFAQRLDNNMHGETYGVELAANWDVTEWWRLRGSYTWLNIDLDREPNTNNPRNGSAQRASPHHQFMVRSSFDIAKRWEFDTAFRYVDAIETPNTGGTGPGSFEVPSYFSLDARLAWRPCRNLELAVVGQNLLDNQHTEFNPTTIRTPRTEVMRTFYGKVTWRF